MQNEQITRYDFEHIILPEDFYSDGRKVLDYFTAAGPRRLRNIYSRLRSVGMFQLLYKESDFNTVLHSYGPVADQRVILCLELPQPRGYSECRRIYLCRRPKTGEQFYFTSELSMQGAYYLCAWTSRHAHLLLSLEEPDDELKDVMGRFEQRVAHEGMIENMKRA